MPYDAELRAVQSARAVFNRQATQIEMEAKLRKDKAKIPLIQAINAALKAGASKNKVAITGMGYAGLAPLMTFLKNAEEFAMSESALDLPTVSTYTFTLHSDGDYRVAGPDITGTVKVLIDEGVAKFGNVRVPRREPIDAETIISEFKAEFKDKYSYVGEDA